MHTIKHIARRVVPSRSFPLLASSLLRFPLLGLSLFVLPLFTVVALGYSASLRAADSNVELARSEAVDYALINVHVLTMDDDSIRQDHAVLVSDSYIEAVIPMADYEPDARRTEIDGQGQYLLPGLAEMHGHVPPLTQPQYLDDTLLLYVAGGVTTVRGMLGHADQLQLKDDIEQGTRLGPTLYLAGPSFNGNTVASAEQARHMVSEHHQAGWDLLKVHPGMGLAEFEAMAERANELGIDFAGHIPEAVPLDVAMAAGIRTIDHLDGYMEFIGATDREISDAEIAELVELTLAHNVGVVPTQALWATLIGAADPDQLGQYEEIKYMPQRVRDGWQRYLDEAPNSRYYSGETADIHQRNRQRLLAAMQDAGVEILMGTDAPQVYSVPGLGLTRELAMMEEAGMTPYEILYSGTVAVGRYFAEYDTFGKVAEGHRADLVLVRDNPLVNLHTLSEPNGVMVRGQWLSRDLLDEKLADIETAHR